MELASVVGLLQKEEDDSVDEDIQALVDERQEARKAKTLQEPTRFATFSKQRASH